MGVWKHTCGVLLHSNRKLGHIGCHGLSCGITLPFMDLQRPLLLRQRMGENPLR